jgi:hypothetical protein
MLSVPGRRGWVPQAMKFVTESTDKKNRLFPRGNRNTLRA